jgi:hypothetical protein
MLPEKDKQQQRHANRAYHFSIHTQCNDQLEHIDMSQIEHRTDH